MQYRLALPADYDMEIIRRRVAERGHLLDQREGLGLKAYLVQDVGRGAHHNQYAPLYLWNDPSAAGAFLWGGRGFAGIVRDFGRPRVQTWIGAAFRAGVSLGSAPPQARLLRRPLSGTGDPQDEVRELCRDLDRRVHSAELHSAAVLVDPSRWELALFELWVERPPAGLGEPFEVLHLSAPGVAELAAANGS